MPAGAGTSAAAGSGSEAFGNPTENAPPVAEPSGMMDPEDDTCASATIEPIVNRTPGNVLVLYDRSLSMNMPFEGNQSRFQATDTALRAGLEPFVCPPDTSGAADCEELLSVGAILFPSIDPAWFPDCYQYVDPIDAASQIYWQPVSSFLESWNTFWGDPLTTGRLILGTPIEDAFHQGALAIESAMLPGTFAVLFLTDGESTCLPGDPLYPAVDVAAQAQMWVAAGIKTYVVSVAPPAGTFNDQVAVAGGTERSINPTDTTQLTDAIREIVGDTVVLADCRTTLSGQELADLEGACARGTVTLGGQPIACDAANGFQIVSSREMELFGSACDGLKTGLVLRAQFPCDVLRVD